MPQARRRSVGLDVQQEALAVACVAHDHGAAVVSLGTLGPRQWYLDPLIRQRHATATHRVVVDETGPCGSWLSRSLTKTGPDGWVVAPACMPTTAGERVTTDRRDARPRARWMRAGDLTPVDVPPVDDDARRELRRAREARLRALNATPSRLNAWLRRQDLRDPGQAHGRPAPRPRPVPDGHTSGGRHSTESRRLTRRVCRAPALPMTPHMAEDHVRNSPLDS